MIYHFQGFELDGNLCELRQAGVPVSVEPKPLEVLAYLVLHRDRVVSVEELLSSVWPGVAVGRSSLHRAVRLIRRAVDSHLATGSVIATVPRAGYRFALDLEASVLQGDVASTTPFVGRERLLNDFSMSLDRAIQVESQAFWIYGPPGIGKTMFLQQAGLMAEAAGACFLAGRCSEGPVAPPYRPWQRILRDYSRKRGATALARAVSSGAEEIGRVFPNLGVGAAAEPGFIETDVSSRYQFFDAMADWLRRASQEQPLVLAFDDLHRADADSLRLLEFIVEELTAERVLVLLAQRGVPTSNERLTEPIKQITRRSPAGIVQLQDFSREEVVQFLESRTREAPSPEEVSAALDRSGGHPLFLEQLIAARPSLGESKLAASDVALHAALRRLTEDATPECRRLIRFAATLGRESKIEVLEAGLAIDSPQMARLVGEARERRIFDSGSTDAKSVRFLHGLIPEVLYLDLEADDRLELHRIAYEGLRRVFRDSPEYLDDLAHHASEASPLLGPRIGFEASRAAGQEALRRCAYQDAIASFERAMALATGAELEPPERIACLRDFARALLAMGRAGEAATQLSSACDLARAVGDSKLFAEAVLSRLACREDLDHHSLLEFDRLEQALAWLGEEEPPLRAQLLAAQCEALYFDDGERTLEAGEKAVALARTLDDPAILATALLRSGRGLDWTSQHERRTEQWREALILSKTHHVDDLLRGRILRAAAEDAMVLGLRAQLDESLAALERFAAERRLLFFEWSAACMRTSMALMEGRYAGVAARIDENLELGKQVAPVSAVYAAAIHKVWLAIDDEDFEAVVAMMEGPVEQFPDVAPWRANLIRGLAEIGDHERARYHTDYLLAMDFGTRRRESFGFTLAIMAEVAFLRRDRATAEIVLDHFGFIRDPVLATGTGLVFNPNGAADRYRGLCAETLDRLDEAIESYELGIAIDESMSALPRAARGHRDLARALIKRGRVDDLGAARRHSECAQDQVRRMARPLGPRVGTSVH